MGLKQNLLKKIKINQLADQVLDSVGTPGGSIEGAAESAQRLNLDPLRQLLEMGDYTHRRERDLDLYLFTENNGNPVILVLDNELKIYRTTIEDVVLRKSPTTKEMLSIRNAIKILSDKDVVISRKKDTLARVLARLIDRLDLSFGPADIEALAQDGRDALQNNYADGVVETLTLFAELLGYVPAPKPFQLAHHRIWGRLEKIAPGDILFGPLVGFNLMRSTLFLIQGPISSRNKTALEALQHSASEDIKADLKGPEVWGALQKAVLDSPSHQM
jgi:hypothetical protein